MKTVEVTLTRSEAAHFVATNEAGISVHIDGPPDLGGKGAGLRPMEMLLASLAGCSALDIIHIVEKQQKEPLEGLTVKVKGVRADAVPAVYTDIELAFEATGQVDAHKLARAVALSMEKYCSVAKMLQPSAKITFSSRVLGG